MFRFRGRSEKAISPGDLVELEKRGAAVRLKCEHAELTLLCPAEAVVRITTAQDAKAHPYSPVAPEKREARVPPEIEESADRLSVRFGGLRLVFSRKPFVMQAYRKERELLLRDLWPGGGLSRRGSGIRLSFLRERGTRFYGLGEKTGPLEKTGRRFTMWNTDMPYTRDYDPIYLSIPFLLVMREGKAFGLFFDNPCRSHFDLGKSSSWSYSYEAEAGDLDLYLIDGPEVKKVVERFTWLTGRMPLPPRWALGHHQCRWSYMNEQEVRGVAEGFRKRDIPTDAIWLDIHYMDRYRVFTVDEKRFPDLPRLSRELREKGFNLVAAMDPGVAVGQDFPLYREGAEKGYFAKDEKGREYHARVWPGKSAFPDFARSEVREWWGHQHKKLLDLGIEGVWNDMNEPSCWTLDLRARDAVLALRPVRRPPMVHQGPEGPIPHLCFRNLYGFMECQAAREGLLRHRPNRRPFILSRSGYAGIQSVAAIWTGDNSSTFSHLALSIPMLLNLGLSGVAFAGADIGGFMWNCTPELYARWIELGAFYPFCRTHCAIKMRRQEPWSFGERVTAIARKYLKLRYRLFPTLYSLFRECHETGAPVWRPLFYEFQEDRTCDRIQDEFMVGPWLLLAPVLEKGKFRRELYLPPAGFRDFWTGEKVQGPGFITREAPLDTMPVYVREGAIIFFQPPLDYLDQKRPDRLTVEAHPRRQGSSEAVLYEDDGETLDYERGLFAKRRFLLERTGKMVRLEVSAKEGDYDPGPRRFLFRFRVDERPAALKLDGKVVPDSAGGWSYNLETAALELEMEDDQAAHVVEIEF